MKPSDPKEVAKLGDRIASLATAINAATQKLSAMIRRFDEAEGWRADGQHSCAQWLSWKTGMSLSTAYEHVRVARRLGQLPRVDEAFAAGELSYCKVRAISRVADEQTEGKLVAGAVQMSGSELELHCRGLRIKQQAFGEREAERYVRLRSLGDGTVKLEAVLSADEAEVVERALRQARRQQADDTADSSAEECGEPDCRQQHEQRDRQRADALVQVARGFLSGGSDGAPATGGDRTELLVHLRATGGGETEPACSATLHESGNWLSREAFERLSCDCSMTVASSGPGGELLDVGRSRRTIPPAVRRALLVRDGCCAFPGCSNRLYLDAHHVRHWSRGGATKLDNLTLLCTRHHRLVHEDGWLIQRNQLGAVRFIAPDGRVIERAPSQPKANEPAARKRRARPRDTSTCDEPSGEEPSARPNQRRARRSRSPASPRPAMGEVGRSVGLAREANPARPAPASSGNHAARRRPPARAGAQP